LDRLLEAIGPKIERVRIEGVGTAAELSGPEPPFIVDEVTGRRIYVSPTTAAMIKGGGLAAADAAKSPTSPPRLIGIDVRERPVIGSLLASMLPTGSAREAGRGLRNARLY
jgi:hypothetical protein